MTAIVFWIVVGLVSLQFLRQRHVERIRRLEIEALARTPSPLLPAADPALEHRLRNLETIVCSVDFELNTKLNRLASQQLQLATKSSAASAAGHAETEAFSIGRIGPGARLAGRFVVERQLGSGGMGTVFRAKDEQLGEVVALKVIAGASMLDPAAADRFRREASAARRISHPNIVRLHDIGEDQGMLFLSMEYVAGTSLSEMIQRQRVLSPAQLLPIASQICSGLEAAHQAGVVHRDLKPHNVLIDDRQQVKIIDFGLARLPHIEGMTATGVILGTPEYMAPEQIRGQAVDVRTDVYALGAVLYHALTGKPPFSGDSPIAIGFAHCSEPLVPPCELVRELPRSWSDVVVRAMHKNPSGRFASAAELQAALPT